MRRVVVRTHGGLGNQTFQLFYARLFSKRAGVPLLEAHDLRYPHRFARSNELDKAPAPTLGMRAVSALRLPKIATRFRLPKDAVTLFGVTYLDGYFQRLCDYVEFDDASLRRELLRLRRDFGISEVATREFGMHLRLGDFFKSDADVVQHLNERLDRLGPNTEIVTNEESRLRTPQVADVLAEKRASIIPTTDMTPEQVLRTLASFRQVDGNDSTLLFWASVLSGMHCEYQNVELRALRARLLAVLKH
jgi:hypothetical protein